MIEQVRGNIRRVGATLLIIILVAAAVFLLFQWRSAEDEQGKVEAQEKMARMQLTQAMQEYDIGPLQEEERELKIASQFPDDLGVRKLSAFLADGARYSQITIGEVTPPKQIGTQAIGGRNYPAYATDMIIRGGLTNIISYIRYLEGGVFTSLKVEGLEVAGSGESWTGEFTVVVISQI
jgi:type II secretory pathway pseudopilin PulG